MADQLIFQSGQVAFNDAVKRRPCRFMSPVERRGRPGLRRPTIPPFARLSRMRLQAFLLAKGFSRGAFIV